MSETSSWLIFGEQTRVNSRECRSPLKKTRDASHESVFREVNVHQGILVNTAYAQMVILALLTGMDRAAPRDAARFTAKV
jgi:hypothetical protein